MNAHLFALAAHPMAAALGVLLAWIADAIVRGIS